MKFTLIVPYYRNVEMLRRQVAEWLLYPEQVSIMLVDDCSPEPAIDVLREFDTERLGKRLSVYRILKDIPWNRGGARNLGTWFADWDWILHIDIDHILPWHCAELLTRGGADINKWYRFPRYRIGAADETRRKDAIPDAAQRGKIQPHIDSYLCTSEAYWKAGGYDEDYSGCLGGGSPFLASMEDHNGKPVLLSKKTYLEVHTRHSVPDASDFSLSRDRSEYTRRKKQKQAAGNTMPKNPLRFSWERIV